jgi:hypothetical protein
MKQTKPVAYFMTSKTARGVPFWLCLEMWTNTTWKSIGLYNHAVLQEIIGTVVVVARRCADL